MKIFKWIGLIAILNLVACKTIKPEKPIENYVPVQIEKELSVINVPIEIAIPDVEKIINQYVSGVLYEKKNFSQTGVEKINLKVSKRENVRLDGKNSVISTKIPLTIATNISAGSGMFALSHSLDFSLNLNFSTKLSINQNWQTISHTSGNGFDWIKKPQVSIAGLDIPLDDILGDVLDKQQSELAKLLDKEINKYLDIKGYAQEAWKSAHTVLQVSEEYDTWLRITPTKIAMTPVVNRNNQITTRIGITTLAETIIGQKPTTTEIKPLPQLELTDTMNDEFLVNLTATISHENATELLKKTLLGQKYSFKDGKYNIELTDIAIFGSNNDLVVKVGLVGSLKGIVYLRGTPYFDNSRNVVGLKNVDFDLKTKNLLVKSANWILHQKFNKKIEESFQIPVASEIKEAKQQGQKYLNNYQVNSFVWLNGNLSELYPDKIWITASEIVVSGLAKGKIKLNVKM